MVSIELQRTHMSFDGLRDVFGALGIEAIACEVEGRQRPDGGYGRCTAVWTVRILAKGVTETNGGVVRTASDPTYLHSGRAAATCFAPSA